MDARGDSPSSVLEITEGTALGWSGSTSGRPLAIGRQDNSLSVEQVAE